MPGGQCTNCIAFNSECTHASQPAPPKNRKSKEPPKNQNKWDSNKSAKDHVAAIVQQATAHIPEPHVRRVLLDVARYARDLENQLAACKPSPSLPTTSMHESSPSPGPDAESVGILTEKLERFSLESDTNRYFGKSSHFQLINAAVGIQERCINVGRPQIRAPPAKRPEYWFTQWEYEHLATEPKYLPLIFPETALLQKLIGIFFNKVNILICLLH
ncbi:hypothetical protein FB45DRAFT_469165 [Roridomyces roridus]|uniref:Uncharacterized protein n=1 Tax=Roridomyces roridus TaxID=1738132 RepID=A0AAD7FR14_9AGAR|nr:hypothetical protein FB45DRAFT_469165 [Roridomyces roridus]